MRCIFSFLLLTSVINLALQSTAVAQMSMEDAIRQQDPAALKQWQSAMPTLEKMGVNTQDLKEGRNSEQVLEKIQRDLDQRVPAKGQQAYKEAKDFVKDPNITESKQVPSGLHMPIFRGNDTKYTRTDLRLSSIPDNTEFPESLTISATEPPATVISWYREALRNDGWRVIENPASRLPKGYSQGSFECQKTGWKCSIQVFGRTGTHSGTQISATAIMEQGE